MKRKQPTTPEAWFDEITLAIADAREARPFGMLVGHQITDASLFHLTDQAIEKLIRRIRIVAGDEQPDRVQVCLSGFRDHQRLMPTRMDMKCGTAWLGVPRRAQFAHTTGRAMRADHVDNCAVVLQSGCAG